MQCDLASDSCNTIIDSIGIMSQSKRKAKAQPASTSKTCPEVAKAASKYKDDSLVKQQFIPFISSDVQGHQRNVFTVVKFNKDAGIYELHLSVFKQCLKGSFEVYKLPLPAELNRSLLNDNVRLIGKQVCIGHCASIFLVHYISSNCIYLRYLLVDIKENDVTCVNDRIGYFDSSYLALQNECMISPDLSWLLVRLPRYVQSNRRRWSKLPAILNPDDLSVHDESLQDRFDMAFAFHPQKPSKYTFLMVNLYCTSCQISEQNLAPKHCELIRQQCNLPISRNTHSQDYMQVEEEVCAQHYYLFLTNCAASFSRTGRWLMLACVARLGNDAADEGVLSLYVLDADSYKVVQSKQQSLPFEMASMYLLPPVMDCIDDTVSVWARNDQNTHVYLGLQCSLPVTLLSLQECCRKSIISTCSCEYIPRLPVPRKLKEFLMFDYRYLWARD